MIYMDLKKLELAPEEQIRRGICDLQKEQPFFAHLSMAMSPQKMPANSLQTAGVDAKGTLYYADDFVTQHNKDQMQALICHEVLHCALQHVSRTSGRIPIIANFSQDIVVDHMVEHAGMKGIQKWNYTDENGKKQKAESIPVDIQHDSSKFTLDGAKIEIEKVSEKMWELIYGEIIDQLRKQGKDPNQIQQKYGWDVHFSGQGMGENGEPEQLTPAEMSKLTGQWQQALANAANYAKTQGHLPAGMERIINEILTPKMQWKALLLKYIKQFTVPSDWSYHKPSRKSHALEVFMPTTIKESCTVEVIVDTSGSIGDREMSEFLTEIVGIAQSMQHIRMWVSFCDTQIYEDARYEVANGDIPKILSMKPKGGGGTSMEAGLDWVKEHNEQVPIVIVLTDGCDTFARTRRDYPFDVIWCITQGGIGEEQMKRVIPYGLKIKMDG